MSATEFAFIQSHLSRQLTARKVRSPPGHPKSHPMPYRTRKQPGGSEGLTFEARVPWRSLLCSGALWATVLGNVAMLSSEGFLMSYLPQVLYLDINSVTASSLDTRREVKRKDL